MTLKQHGVMTVTLRQGVTQVLNHQMGTFWKAEMSTLNKIFKQSNLQVMDLG